MYNSAYFSKRYYVVKKIGTGGMSSVYLCIDKNIHKKWAVKQLTDSSLNGRQMKNVNSHFVNSEIELLKSLDYYMFPRISDAFTDNGKICIVTDYIDGETLSSYLKNNGRLRFDIAIGYFKELLKALNYLHTLESPILYLDMKPANIMVRPDGEIRLIDFGIAGSILLKSKSIGSIGYSPPEQYIEGAELSEKSDIFALAMTFYEMVTGKRPDSDLSVQRENIRKCRSIPAALRDVLLKCTESDMKKRLSVNEILNILNKRNRYERGVIPVTVITCILSVVFLVTAFKSAGYYRQYIFDKNEREMLEKAEQYLVNGSYSGEGIRIICGYIDGHFLDEDVNEKYTYEVAKNFFEVQKDYAMAGIYFRRLDENKYPDAAEYIRICNKMRSFEGDEEQIISGLMKLEIDENTEEVLENNG